MAELAPISPGAWPMCSDRPAPPRRTPHVRARPNPPEHARRPRTAARSPRTCDHGMMRSEGRWFGCPIHFRVGLPVESACLLHLPSSPAAVLRADPVRRRSHPAPSAARAAMGTRSPLGELDQLTPRRLLSFCLAEGGPTVPRSLRSRGHIVPRIHTRHRPGPGRRRPGRTRDVARLNRRRDNCREGRPVCSRDGSSDARNRPDWDGRKCPEARWKCRPCR